MILRRRTFLSIAAGGIVLPTISRIVRAQTYPMRTVRIIVGFGAGSGADIVARLMGQRLTDRLGQQFIVEVRPGAGSNIATEAVVNAAPDGHTLLLATSANATSATFYDNLNFNFIRDITPVAGINRIPFVIVVNPSFPAKTVPELIAYAKANPGKLTMASAGNGTLSHTSGELLKMTAGVNMLHVPYRGGAPAITDVLGGQVQVYFSAMPEPIEYIKTGKLRALAVTTANRADALPDIPSLGDFIAGYETSAWQGIGVPKNTPTEIVDKLNREINAALADASFKARLTDFGSTPLAGSPADFGKLVADDTDKWRKVIRSANIKAQ
jgi:tripartite-type tricarboxylate transporter receptor subunit TctC